MADSSYQIGLAKSQVMWGLRAPQWWLPEPMRRGGVIAAITYTRNWGGHTTRIPDRIGSTYSGQYSVNVSETTNRESVRVIVKSLFQPELFRSLGTVDTRV